MSENTINFTKQTIEKLSTPSKGFTVYKDSKEKGLSLYVTSSGVKTFFVRKRISGKDQRVIIGSFPEISTEQARKSALSIKSKVVSGINPLEEKKKLKSEITFGQLFEQYLEKHAKRNKRTWQDDVWEFNKFLKMWANKKISTITTNDIRSLREKIHDNHGLYQSNRILSRISAIFNKAIEWGYDGKNPAKGVKKYREKSRDRFISPDELPRFFESLENETKPDMKDFFYLCLFTGGRRQNILSMRWSDIDFNRQIWRIPVSKNGDPINVPLLEEATNILLQRKESSKSPWVFPSLTSKVGHLVEPKSAWKRILTRAGIKDLRIHDIRRTLGSYQAITGASLQIIGKSLGHKTSTATQIYSRLNLDPVRESMFKATSEILRLRDKGKE